MSATIHIELTRVVDGPDLLAALAARGLAGELVEEDRVAVRVGDADVDAHRLQSVVSHALDEWVTDHELPFVPTRLGDDAYVLRPPAG